MMLIFLIGIGVLVYYLYNDDNVTLKRNKTADELLKERFIKGEIDEKTYLQMKETIKK